MSQVVQLAQTRQNTDASATVAVLFSLCEYHRIM